MRHSISENQRSLIYCRSRTFDVLRWKQDRPVRWKPLPLAENLYRLSKPLRRELEAYRTARRGDYRVLLRIDDDNHVIVIVAVEHRAHIYRRR